MNAGIAYEMFFDFFPVVICNKFELLTFPRQCNNIVKVWWEILCSFVGNIHPLFSSERILKIGYDF